MNRSYWSLLTQQIRQTLSCSQEKLASQLGIDQGTVSRWERGVTEPVYPMREVLMLMARDAGLTPMEDIAQFVRASPFLIVLTDRNLRVVAASVSSGFRENVCCVEQTPEHERGQLLDFGDRLEQAGFWDGDCSRLDYRFRDGDAERVAVATPVRINGMVYALVQKHG
ncbi:XRE family transcriptional regulator [Methylolobus aquaticus]|nr:XRE family transcriptional regulator [Methylolobus aquaticus]